MSRNDGGPAFDLSQYDASTRMRWFAVMTAWGVPHDLPFDVMNAWGAPHDLSFDVEPGTDMSAHDCSTRYPLWSAAMKAVRASLTEEQQSWGWWREQKLGSFEDWKGFWLFQRGVVRVTIDENGERAKEQQP